MVALRVHRFGMTLVNAPALRIHRFGMTVTAPSTPALRVHRFGMTVTAAVLLNPITAQTVEPEQRVDLAAVLTAGGSADSYTWRSIPGPGATTVTLAATGAACWFTSPSSMDGTTVVVGVTATKSGVTSLERQVTITVLPQTIWGWDGSKWIGAPMSIIT